VGGFLWKVKDLFASVWHNNRPGTRSDYAQSPAASRAWRFLPGADFYSLFLSGSFSYCDVMTIV
jgi:hypothetical protein